MSVWPAWKVREHDDTTSWYHVRLAFPDGARVDALAVVHEGRVSIEDVSAEPALSLADLTALSRWIEGPLFTSCGLRRPYEADADEPGRGDGEVPREADGDACPQERQAPEADGEQRDDVLCGGPWRARPFWPRGIEGCRLVAQRYRAAQEEGADPVLAVMSATGRSRRRSLRLIAQARDAGFLTPRHARRG
ncbi:DUF6214 family protein [Streptomyces sp. NPDC048191]|uniref:DUF6214 family protein n=1 Tax=Streptomyces sp. NPDC048191 TaxID=3155484 RepID=UPI0033E4931D